MSHDPPYVTIGCTHTRQRPNHMKDSEQNLLETGCAAWRRTEHARLPELPVCLPPASLSPMLYCPCSQLCTLHACSASKIGLSTCAIHLDCAAGGREFTLNMISEWFAESANHTCAPPSTRIVAL